jgi:putative flippase GtrA
MTPRSSPSDWSPAAWLRARLDMAWRNRVVIVKATSFAFIGAVNTVLDYCVFLLARAAYGHSPAALALFDWLSGSCRCGSPAAIHLIAANMTSWLVAVTSSYILNSSITFAAESGRKLRWRSYLTFAVFGIAGLIANTAMLVVAAQILLLPVWLAKGIAVMASFVVNFSLSHFIVFRVRAEP